jgi:hypothetical protein
MCLASLVYHAEWMIENFPASHFVILTPLFSHQIANKYKDIGHCCIPNGNVPFANAGIPSHISILTKLRGMMDEVRHVVPRIDSALPEVFKGVTQLLEERAMGAVTVMVFRRCQIVCWMKLVYIWW